MKDLNILISTYPVLFIFLSFITGLLLMPYVIKIAKEKNLIVKPNKRTSHKGKIPNIGGINIFSSFIIPFLIFSTSNFLFINTVIVGMYFILLVGFFDDLVELNSYKKLIGEIIAGIILIILADVRITHLHGFLGINELPILLSYFLSFFVFLLIVNSFNLIDGVDGLASGLGVISFTFFAIYFNLTEEYLYASIAYGMIGTLLIFFIYNVFGGKLKIFMGDSGALVIGYTLYFLVTTFCELNAYQNIIDDKYQLMAAPAVAIAVLSLPLFDTLRVVITRLKKGLSPFQADKNHMHHLLLSIGLKHREVSFLLIIVNISFIILGLLIANWKIEYSFIPLILYAYILIFVMWRVVDKHNLKNK